MTRARGNRLQNALAAYLTAWWPHAESAGAGRQGTDVLGTPGVVWECKTAVDFKRDFRPAMWVHQAESHAKERGWLDASTGHLIPPPVPVVVYFPAGIGAANTGNTLAIVPLHVLMQILEEGGYVPDKPRECVCEENRLYGTCGHLRTNRNDRKHIMTSGTWLVGYLSTAALVIMALFILVAKIAYRDGHYDGRAYERNRRHTRAIRAQYPPPTRLLEQPRVAYAGQHAPWQPRVTVARAVFNVSGGPAGITAPIVHRRTDTGELRGLVAGSDLFIDRMRAEGAAYRGELVS